MCNFFIPIRNENEKQCSRTLIILDFVAELFYTTHFDFDDSLLSKAALKTKPASTKWRQKARIFGEKGNKNLLSNVKTQHYKKNIKKQVAGRKSGMDDCIIKNIHEKGRFLREIKRCQHTSCIKRSSFPAFFRRFINLVVDLSFSLFASAKRCSAFVALWSASSPFFRKPSIN